MNDDVIYASDPDHKHKFIKVENPPKGMVIFQCACHLKMVGYDTTKKEDNGNISRH